MAVAHGGEKISFGASSLTALATSLVEIGLADEADWTTANRSPSGLVSLLLQPDDPNSVREALRVIEVLLRVLVLAIEIKKIAEPEDLCTLASMSAGDLR